MYRNDIELANELEDPMTDPVLECNSLFPSPHSDADTGPDLSSDEEEALPTSSEVRRGQENKYINEYINRLIWKEKS